MKKNILIIGGNAAGPAAAAKAKRVSPDSNVILFEAGDFISTGTCELPYVLSGEIDDYNKIIFYDEKSFEEEKKVKVYTKSFVTNINRNKKNIDVINLYSNQKYQFDYDKLILATGSKANKLPLFPSTLNNVFTFKSVSDLIKIQNHVKQKKSNRVLVIGAGYIGIEVSEALKKLGFNLILLEKEKFPMPDAEPEIQNLILNTLNENKIEFISGSQSVKYFYDEKRLKNISINGWQYEIDFAIQCIGVKPNSELALTSKIELGNYGGIKVDSKLKTNDSNIFAAGDCIEVINKITNKYEYIPLATLAHEFGHIAGENAAGGNQIIKPIVKNIAVKIFDKIYVSVGLTCSQAHKYKFLPVSVNAIVPNIIKVMPNSKNVFGKIIYDKNSLMILGASFFGGNEVIGFGDLISSFIHNKIKANELAEINYNYTPPSSPFINLLSVLGRKIKKEIK
ncbi:MAG: FAD-dependent oxidoreductase [Melioribacteraceae bacterium]|nr:FAD-dependent oxidoreductase [Melioribacteraceae bacterium]